MKCGLMRKIVTWEGTHVSALRSQMVSNDFYALQKHEDLVHFF